MTNAKQAHNGFLIVFEGIDGTGKTTQAEMLAEHIESLGGNALRSREPTHGPWGRRLRDSAISGRLAADEEVDLFIKDRRQHVEKVVAPALADGAFVIIDRYFLSTAAYQGARGLNPEEIMRANEAFAPTPDIAFLLELSPTHGRHRVRKRGDGDGDLFEVEEQLGHVAEIFTSLERDYIVRIDADRDVASVHSDIVAALKAHPRSAGVMAASPG